jgi:hypothetical protein
MRTHKLVKSAGPDDLVFQSVQTGRPMNDQKILKRHIQAAARKMRFAVRELALLCVPHIRRA